MSHDPNCLFCKIAAGDIPSTKVHEDDEFVAFRDIRPAADTHVLVIPRRHVPTLSSVTAEDAPLLGRMLVLVARLAEQLGCAYVSGGGAGGETGFRTVINTGPGGGQEVYHLHAHVLAGPRPWRRMG
ncbi:histidine triad nucleotide-binding protein [Burkholderia sp. TSV86]|uniref:histidine triad nucleotide-binding protein n=1 Tax=Burkholderia sp. TSV86 TaxID=1385594 RepID=UPI00075C487F|nr:histidine triad nucleotide-binding protein [Burkholderia sp. TSV86]KVE36045.1 histidine triad nucleotide-binding protein [Burkholderia sp. TSV86]